jgi:hypothetical protein
MSSMSNLFGGPNTSPQAPNQFQAISARMKQQDFAGAMNGALQRQQGVQGNQDSLIASLQAQANGTGGPNLAQAQLQNATQANSQQAAGAIASARGLNQCQ